MPKGKYSVLLLPNFGPSPEYGSLTKLDDNTLVGSGRFSDLLDSEDTKHWKEWLGSINWETLFEHDSLFFISLSPNGQENESELDGRSGDLFRCMTLGFEWTPPEERCAIFSGDYEQDGNEFVFSKVQSFSRTDHWFRPGYFESEFNFTNYDAKAESPETVREIHALYQRFQKIFPGRRGPHLMGVALLSFEESVRNGRLEFKLPNQVRAIEAVVAMSKKFPGPDNFAQRAKRFAPGPNPFYKFTEEEVVISLKEAYLIRNACVHGMMFDHRIRDQIGGRHKELVPKYEYLVESVARNAVRWALNNDLFLKYADDRDELEKAWEEGKFDVQ